MRSAKVRIRPQAIGDTSMVSTAGNGGVALEITSAVDPLVVGQLKAPRVRSGVELSEACQ